ncbi:MAG: tRNA (N(6)-L-threonylcarbamoyladenosine(37)-C(2))-methylthiotransferase MtaB [Christensenellales bacterium]|jgi:threonylcarbamoyladenosine tRNA methylthiotransferase MtaB
MKTVAFHTLGCKVNQYDTEAMREAFLRAGYLDVPFSQDADVYLVNTCTVTGTGDQKSLKMIRRVARAHPNAAIVAAGCLAQRDAEALFTIENVRLVLGVKRRAQVVDLIETALREGRRINAVGSLEDAPFEDMRIERHAGRTRATMKIQEGCDRNCAYCIIPRVRGPVRSMPLSGVRDEAARLADAGHREIVLAGIHLASYGRGTQDTLLDAIRAVHETGVRVRIGSLEPGIVTDSFAYALSTLPHFMRQFHLSLQSGSAGVLARMRRRYNPEQYEHALDTIRRFMPDSAITTDILTGFPGETDAEHAQTMDFAARAGFARLHVFPFSPRTGTPAAAMPDQIGEAVKRARAAELIALGNKLEAAFVQGLEGTVQTVLFEARVDELCEGESPQSVRVRAHAEPGEVVRVRIIRAEGATAYGEPFAKGGR